MLGLEAKIVGLLGVDFHSAYGVGLVDRLDFVWHGAPPRPANTAARLSPRRPLLQDRC
jgi:hypothetical protein